MTYNRITSKKMQNKQIKLTLQNVVKKSAASFWEKFFVVRNENVSQDDRVISAALRLRVARLPRDSPRMLWTISVPGIFWSRCVESCTSESLHPAMAITFLTSRVSSGTLSRWIIASCTSAAAATGGRPLCTCPVPSNWLAFAEISSSLSSSSWSAKKQAWYHVLAYEYCPYNSDYSDYFDY